MLQFLVRRAQHAFDHLVAAAIMRVAVAVPILIALGFLAAALSAWLTETYGPTTSHLVMAGLFALLAGVIAALSLMHREEEPAASTSGARSSSSSAGSGSSATGLPFSASDRDLMLSLAATLGPAALPYVIRLLFKNLPLVAAIAVAAYVMSRPVKSESMAASSQR